MKSTVNDPDKNVQPLIVGPVIGPVKLYAVTRAPDAKRAPTGTFSLDFERVRGGEKVSGRMRTSEGIEVNLEKGGKGNDYQV